MPVGVTADVRDTAEASLPAAARDAFAAVRPRVEALFAELWNAPELPAMEARSANALACWLEEEGFAIERAAADVPTAFIARAVLSGVGGLDAADGSGPRIGILLEYDALPGLANAAAPARQPIPGARAGHACGHNHIGPANAGAAVAAVRAARALGLRGEVVAFGCPAEEIVWGKVAMLRRGAFDGCDALLTSHGDYQTGALSRPCQSVVSGEFVFSGRAGHGGMVAAANALDAAELAVQSVHRLRASRFSDAPVKHVLRSAGIMPGITPDEVRVWFSARAATLERARETYTMVHFACTQASALSGCGVRHQFIAETRGYLPNDTLGHVLFDAVRKVGPPRWSTADLAFMQELSVAAAVPGVSAPVRMTLDRSLALFAEGADYYGQDDGEASWRIPLGRVNWAYPQEVPIHHWAWTALSGHRASTPGPLMAGEALALGALNLLREPAILEAAKRELEARVRDAAASGRPLDMPRIGAWRTLTRSPETFWDATWDETSEEFP